MSDERDSSLVLDVKPGNVVHLDGDRIKVELVEKSGKIARLRILAPLSVDIHMDSALNKDA